IANLPAVATSFVDLEPRPLPSAGVTRLPRYYGPLRLPGRPGLALTGVRLGHAPAAWGLPCCAGSPCADMPSPLPRWDRWCASLIRHQRRRPSPSPCRVGSHRELFRGLLGVHVSYGLPARGVAVATLSIGGFGSVVASTTAPIATGWSDSCRGGIAPP